MLSVSCLWMLLIPSSSSQGNTSAFITSVDFSFVFLCIQRKPPPQRCLIEAADRRQGEKFLQHQDCRSILVAWEDNDMACVTERGQRRWGLSWENMSVVYYCLQAQRIWETWHTHTKHSWNSQLIWGCIGTEDSPLTHKPPSNIACVVRYKIFCKIQDLQRTVNRRELPFGRIMGLFYIAPWISRGCFTDL